MKVLAVDYGSQRIGLAVGDTLTRVATPLGQIAARDLEQVLAEIMKRVGEFEVGHIVVGYPLNMRTAAAAAPAPRWTASSISCASASTCPSSLVDEKLSSFAAEEMAKEIEHDFRKRKKFLDSVAAQVILQTYFEQP